MNTQQFNNAVDTCPLRLDCKLMALTQKGCRNENACAIQAFIYEQREKVACAIQEVLANNGFEGTWDDHEITQLTDCADRHYDVGVHGNVYEFNLGSGSSLFYHDLSDDNWQVDSDATSYFSSWDGSEEILECVGLLEPDELNVEPDELNGSKKEVDVAIWVTDYTTKGEFSRYLRDNNGDKLIFSLEEAEEIIWAHESVNPYHLSHGEMDKPRMILVKA